jgi:hypothetical protein
VKKYLIYVFLSILCFFVGVTLFLVKRDWLILHWVPSYKRSEDISGVLGKKVAPKKNIKFYYWKDEQLKNEENSLVWLSGKGEITKLIVGNWLSFIYEERILGKRVGIESAALDSTEQVAYLSFDQALFLREWSLHKKWQLLDGLLRTIADSGLGIQKIVFLAKNEPMSDDQLDFSQPWPVER